MTHLGIDYGSKLAGTTAICIQMDGALHVFQSRKKEDADQFIAQHIADRSPVQVFLDAPLSLPLAYHGLGEDFFYRQCDRALGAMSPMFLGGLTARAMRLKHQHPMVRFFEVYPKFIASRLLQGHFHLYKKDVQDIPMLTHVVIKGMGQIGIPELINWHQFDAVLAWASGRRYNDGVHEEFGSIKEGVIII